MLGWCRQGPPHAKVQRVDVSDAEPEGLYRFAVR